MTSHLRIVIPALWAAWVLALPPAGAGGSAGDEQTQGDPWSRWSHTAAITPQGETSGLVSFPLSLEVFDLARPDLADLRVLSGAGDETGYIVQVDRGWEKKKPVPVELYNRTCLPGQQSSVTASFGEKILKNRIEIITPGKNFRRAVTVEGSDDGDIWHKVKEGVFLFNVTGGEGESVAGYDKNYVDIPDNNQPLLRITVFNAPDDPERIEIEAVHAWHYESKPARTVKVQAAVGIAVTEKSVTTLSVDLGLRNVPLAELTLRFSEDNFYRAVTVLGRNRETRVQKTRREGGKESEKIVEEPWERLGSGVIYSFVYSGVVEASNTLKLDGKKTRYLRVQIENRDDKPLSLQEIEVRRLAYFIEFKAQKGRAFTLYLGNAEARSPDYDFVHFVDRLRLEGVTPAKLSAPSANPAYALPEEQIPLSEQHKGIIWVALLAMLAVLAVLIYRLARKPPDPSGG
ncbi:MAG: DUF3999 family protein [Pseudomonadota bacterium]